MGDDAPRSGRKAAMKDACNDLVPAGFTGHWREWHRGHGCNLDDGSPRSRDFQCRAFRPERTSSAASCVARRGIVATTDRRPKR